MGAVDIKFSSNTWHFICISIKNQIFRTNLPKEVMNFPDWPVVKGSKESCVMHHIILKYLKNYTNHFCLRRFIKVN